MMDGHKPVLEAIDLAKVFKTPKTVEVFSGLNLTVCGGESLAITGKSGQGKSTLLQVLGTLDPPSKGQVKIMGKPLSPFNVSKIRRQHVAFVFQSFHLLEDYTVLDNILMPAKISREDTSVKSSAHHRALHLLDRIGLSERANFNTKLLSGGEKQRVAIARAFCNDPDILFADEPSGNLDSETASVIHGLLLEFSAQPNKALVLVTHDDTLAKMCSRHYEIVDGSLISG